MPHFYLDFFPKQYVSRSLKILIHFDQTNLFLIIYTLEINKDKRLNFQHYLILWKIDYQKIQNLEERLNKEWYISCNIA